MPATLEALIRAFINDAPRNRIQLSDLRAHLSNLNAYLPGDPDARARLAASLQSLAEADLIRLPRGNTHWDSRMQPPLPTWVSRSTLARTTQSPVMPRVWPAALEPAASIATRPDELNLLNQIATWMREDPGPLRVPVEERSLQLTGDEKALGRASTTRLFTSGALTFDLLSCFLTPLPFVSQHITGTGPTVLVIAENLATYHSLLTTLRQRPVTHRPDSHIAWGVGHQVPVSAPAITLLEPEAKRVLYFGDLDVAGLRIAVNTTNAVHSMCGLSVEPAAAFYAAALIHGVPRPDASRAKSDQDLTELINWLPDQLRSSVRQLLNTGQRIAQETVGARLMHQQPALLDSLMPCSDSSLETS